MAKKSFIPPVSVANAAKKALKMRKSLPKSQRGMTRVGLARANQLANRRPVSLETIKRMVSYFDRHEVDKQSNEWKTNAKSKGRQAWLGWGSDAGWAWAKRILKENSD